MIRKSDKKDHLFYVVCADWETVIAAKDASEAATVSVEMANREYGKELCLSPSMTVMDLHRTYDELDAVESTDIFYTPQVLADAGLHDLSKKYASIIKLIGNDSSENKNIQ